MISAHRALGWLAPLVMMACARSGPPAPAEPNATGGANAGALGAAPVVPPSPPAAPEPGPSAVGVAGPSAAPGTKPPSAAESPGGKPELEKTSGITHVERPGPPRLLHAVRAATAAGYDRVVFEFQDGVPGFHLEYVDRPIRDCGAGDVKPVEGDGWLEVRFSPANAHSEAGQPTVAERELLPRLPVVREIERTCDFEAVVTWVVGTASPNRYRAFELREPPRLVIDIDH